MAELNIMGEIFVLRTFFGLFVTMILDKGRRAGRRAAQHNTTETIYRFFCLIEVLTTDEPICYQRVMIKCILFK